jgi:hypothetical protein
MSDISVTSSPSIRGSVAVLMMSGKTCQFVILFDAICTILVLRTAVGIYVTGNCENN